MKKGTLVLLKWWDIQADLHTDEQIDVILAESVGWIKRDTKTIIELENCRYTDDCGLRDGIAIPKGCVESILEIKL